MSVSPVAILAVTVLQLLFVLGIVIGLFLWRYKKVPPGKVMLIYGKGVQPGKEFAIVYGGGKFIIPVVQSYSLLSLEMKTLKTELKDVVAVTSEGETSVDVSYTVQYRIGSSDRAITLAAPLFLNASEEDMEFSVRTEVERALREVLSKYDLEKIIPLLDRYASLIAEKAQRNLEDSGMELRNLVIRGIDHSL
ncbi:MAG: SPFH domain-containing protein [Thermoplasmatota archaeon]